MTVGFEVREIARLGLVYPPALEGMYVLSPFVWPSGTEYRALFRLVNRASDPHDKISRIHAASSRDGLVFTLDREPIIAPGPASDDRNGCEDPTVAASAERVTVYYSGWNQQAERSTLMRARELPSTSVEKCGVAIASTATRENPKEASLARAADGTCRLFFEYAADGASRIGIARADSIDGPWTVLADDPLAPRAGAWDDWHLSPGPIIDDGTDRPILFYNGGTKDAKWRIGWVVFSGDFTRVLARCDEPIVVPPEPMGDESDIAFASSVIDDGERIELYYSVADKVMQRATLARTSGGRR